MVGVSRYTPLQPPVSRPTPSPIRLGEHCPAVLAATAAQELISAFGCSIEGRGPWHMTSDGLVTVNGTPRPVHSSRR